MSVCNLTNGAIKRYTRSSGAAALLVGLVLGLPACERKVETTAEQPEGGPRIAVLPEGAAKPNIVMIVVDALRADRLGAYGHKGKLTPTMDALSSFSVTFDNCVAPAPWTLPAVASLFTSYYPGVHQATSYRTVENMEQGRTAVQSVLSEEFDTLAEVLQANGYQTAGFCANKFIREQYGFGQGFDHFDSSFAENTVAGSKVNDAAVKWLGTRAADKPFFMYLHYMDVHGPYNAAPQFMDPLMELVEKKPDKQLLTGQEIRALNPYLNQPPPNASDPGRYERLKGYREYWLARYEAGVAEADFHILQLFRSLKEAGVWSDAYVILLSDHGEALCEHGLWDHGYSQYQTDLRVPLLMRWPGVLPGGMRVRRLASIMDIMPTLLEQLRLPPGENLQGASLVRHITGTLPDTPLVRFSEAVKSGPPQFALYTDSTKLMTTVVPPQRLPDGTTSKVGTRQQLFLLATDPGEQFDVSDQNPQVTEQLSRLLGKVVQTNKRTKPGLVVSKAPVDSATVAQLSSLGYVGGTEEPEPNEPEPTTQPAVSPATQPAAIQPGDEETESGEGNP